MKGPICDFLLRYAESDPLRLHMPGHKGLGPLGAEALDITEIKGADSLYEASGIIRESEANTGRLFGAATFYSAEGSSLAIRAMLSLVASYAAELGRRPRVVAARNAHKVFVTASALLDLDVLFLPSEGESYLSARVDADLLDRFLSACEERPIAVYLTSPDYLGNTVDIGAISAVCRRHGTLLLVDNAHGAYLRFLSPSRHPLDLGADLVADSAHKTLPALTGAAYLHVGASAPAVFRERARGALSLFGSTSPSYLILASLDALASELEGSYPDRLRAFVPLVADCRAALAEAGYATVGDEPLKLTLLPKSYGYTGDALAELLIGERIVPEFSDPDHLTLMLTPEIGEAGLSRLTSALLRIPKKAAILEKPPRLGRAERILSLREAVLGRSERIPAEASLGRILAAPTVGCPPAVPIVISGERISESAIRAFRYYGIDTVSVVACSEKHAT